MKKQIIPEAFEAEDTRPILALYDVDQLISIEAYLQTRIKNVSKKAQYTGMEVALRDLIINRKVAGLHAALENVQTRIAQNLEEVLI